MRRLVVALTTLLTLVGAAVVAGYLFLLAPAVDRAATMTPATSVAYVSVYLSPSTGQGLELADLLTRLPGLSDASSLADKLDQIIQRSLSGAGLDYHADVKPWLGDQLAVALVPAPAASGALPITPVILASVRDEAAARTALSDIAKANGTALTTTTYRGVTVYVIGSGAATSTVSHAAIVDATLLVSTDETALEAAVDAATGNASSLADASSYRSAMATLPADRLASIYIDASAADLLGGSSGTGTSLTTAGLAVIAQPGGLQVVGRARLQPGASPSQSVAGASAPSGLTDWMPDSTEAEVVVFGAGQTFDALTAQLGSVPGGQGVAQSIAQLRALAALGLGINVDHDLLPLFDRESAIAVQGLSGTTPHGQLILRPSDGAAAAAALTRITDGLSSRGAEITSQQADGTTITVVVIPQVGQLAYALQDGVVVAGLSAGDVTAALDAHASGKTLSASAGYRAAFEVAGGRAGNEVYVAGARGVELLLGLVGQSPDSLSADLRDILNQVSAVAISTPATQNTIEIHATVTVH